MLICHCKNKTDREIRHALSRGARSCDDVAARCDAGNGCGGCHSAIRALLERQGRVERRRHRPERG